MKRKIMVYCGEDGAAGKIEALARNTDETSFIAACGFQFDGQPEGDSALIMPDLPAWRRDIIAEAYNHKVEYVKAAQAPRRRPMPADVIDHRTIVPPDLAAEIAAEHAPEQAPKRRPGRPRKVKAPVITEDADNSMYNESP